MKKFNWGKLIIPAYVLLMIIVVILAILLVVSCNNNRAKTEESVESIVETEESSLEEETTESEVESEVETTESIDDSLSIMFTTTDVNVRTEPNTDCEILTTLLFGTEVKIYNYSEEDEWSQIYLGKTLFWIKSEFLAKTREEAVEAATEKETHIAQIAPAITNLASVLVDEFHYYGIYTGKYWHFTPEQIDNQWSGHKSYKPKLEEGTTRAWQKYLYEALCAKGLGWWYKMACAQAMQESGFNPLNNTSIDHGLFSFRERYWDNSYGDILDYKANINAYIDRIEKFLTGANSDEGIYYALSQHFNPDGKLHMNYVNSVLNRLNELWVCD